MDQQDLQGNILCGYGNEFRHALYVFARVKDAAAGRALIGDWLEADRVTNAVPWSGRKPESTLNVAFNWRGLGALGVADEVLAKLPKAFRADMGERADLLGDTGPSAPREWDDGLRPRDNHMLVTLFARSAQAMARQRAELLGRLEDDPGLELAREEPAELLGHPGEGQFGREHFGFADGLSQPTIADPQAGPHDRRGRGTPKRLTGWDSLAPGEFVLGYLDEDGVLPEAPPPPLGRSGSYMVVRKLHQHVDVFTNYLRLAAGATGEPEEELAAKMVGRYRDGRPVARPAADGPKLLNDFRYRSDGKGERCPVGAHIRRANPRDGLGFQGRLTKRHRIIRRGMPYGPPPENQAKPDDVERGLMFVCYQASIERQFEVVQGLWLNDGESLGLGSDKDFLVSTGESAGKLTIPRRGQAPILLAPQPAFVTTKGGGYYFTPGIGALDWLAAMPAAPTSM